MPMSYWYDESHFIPPTPFSPTFTVAAYFPSDTMPAHGGSATAESCSIPLLPAPSFPCPAPSLVCQRAPPGPPGGPLSPGGFWHLLSPPLDSPLPSPHLIPASPRSPLPPTSPRSWPWYSLQPCLPSSPSLLPAIFCLIPFPVLPPSPDLTPLSTCPRGPTPPLPSPAFSHPTPSSLALAA